LYCTIIAVITKAGAKSMKRRDLIKKLEANGWYFERHGANHDIYTNGVRKEAIERHREISER
jgi:mRNA interferase HicA